jgi:hypothetical protein
MSTRDLASVFHYGRPRAAEPRLARLLKKALPAIVELHVQGIGCPDCDRDEDTGEHPEACPFVREVEAAIAKAGVA